MNKLLATLITVSAFAFGSTAVLADDSDMKPLTKAQTDATKAARAEAKAKWATMTPEEQAATKKAAAAKKGKDLTMLEAVGQESDMTSAAARAEAKKNIEASKPRAAPQVGK